MNGRIVARVVLGLVLIAVLVGLGVVVYNLGVVQGAAQGGNLPLPERGAMPYVYAWPFMHRGFGFWPGFGLLGCLIPLLGLLFLFALVRWAFWPRHWGHTHMHGPSEHGVPPAFEEWHRKAHEPGTGNPEQGAGQQ